MNVVFRTVAYAAWALAFGLSIWLAVEFHDYNFGISFGVAVLALIFSAFGLMLARHCAQHKDRLAMMIGIILWAAGAVSFAITELGYWSSSYKDRYAEYVEKKSTKARQEGLKDLAWQAVRTGEARATVAELEARQKAAKQNAFWTSSDGCTKATGTNSRAFCQTYFEMEAKIASAKNIEALEKRLEHEKPDAKGSIVHNVFAGAELLAENTDLTEEQAAVVVILIIATVLMLGRDLLLIVANSNGGATAASGRAKASEATPAPLKVFPPAAPRTALPESPIAGLLSRKTIPARADGKPVDYPWPDPTPPADAALPVEEPKPVETAPARPRLVDENWVPTPPLSKKQRKLVQRERMKDDAIRAMEEFVSSRLDLDSDAARFTRTDNGFVQSGGTPGTELAKEFRQWAKSTKKWAHFATYDKNPLGKALSAVLEQGRPSKGGGSVYAALIKRPAVTEKPVRRAA